MTFNKKYNTDNEEVLLFAMGDGNHSLATAKKCYEDLKKNTTPDEIFYQEFKNKSDIN